MLNIPYSHQSIDEEDIAAVCSVLRSDWLTQGPKIKEFERTLSDYCGAQFAVAVSSGTAALHIACLAVGLGKDDVLWTSPNTFVASANCALYCGAKPDFVDIDPRTYNMSIDVLETKLIKSLETRSLPKVVVPVHFAGQATNLERLQHLSREYKFNIIEDACHAFGGAYKGSKIGSCSFSDMTVFSFHPVKSVTTGEGGAILTDNEELYQKLIRLRSHGITRNSKYMDREPEGPWYYQQIELGMNYRITDIQAALGISQTKRIDSFVARRHELALGYNEKLSGLPVVTPYQVQDAYSAFHLYIVRIKLAEIQKARKEVFVELQQKGIGVNVHYIPVHTHPYYQRLGFSNGQFPEAERYYQEAITLPLYPSLSDKEQDYVIASLHEILS